MTWPWKHKPRKSTWKEAAHLSSVMAWKPIWIRHCLRIIVLPFLRNEKSNKIRCSWFLWMEDGFAELQLFDSHQHPECSSRLSPSARSTLVSQSETILDVFTPMQSMTTVMGMESSNSSSLMGVRGHALEVVDARDLVSGTRDGVVWGNCTFPSLDVVGVSWAGGEALGLGNDGGDDNGTDNGVVCTGAGATWNPNWSYLSASSYDGGDSIRSVMVLGLPQRMSSLSMKPRFLWPIGSSSSAEAVLQHLPKSQSNRIRNQITSSQNTKLKIRSTIRRLSMRRTKFQLYGVMLKVKKFIVIYLTHWQYLEVLEK